MPMPFYLLPYLHVLSFMILFGALLVEHLMFRPEFTAGNARTLMRVGIVYGLAALSTLTTGILRMIFYGKGVDYYMSNSIFVTKALTFFAVATLSIVPTALFLSWRKDINAGTRPVVDPGKQRLVIVILRLEILGFLIMPLLAVMMARGAG